MQHYWLKCSPRPLSNGTVNSNHILSGAEKMLNQLEKMEAINTFSTVYIDSDGLRGGQVLSCKEAFATIKTRVNSINSVDNKLKSICSSAGFNTKVANELQSCKEALDWISEKTNLEGAGGDFKSVLVNTSLDSIILASMESGNADSLYALRKLIISGKGDNNLVIEFMPVLQSGLFAISYMLLPFILLLAVTPLFKKALTLTFGLIALNSLWNISMAITNSLANESAIRFFDSLEDVKYGLNSMDIIGSASIKALSVFSNYQTSSLMIATMLLATLFGISAYALSGLADQVDNKASQAFDEAAQKFNTDEGRSQFRDSVTTGLSNNAFAKEHGNQAFLDRQNIRNADIASADQIREQGKMGIVLAGATASATGSAVGSAEGLSASTGSNNVDDMAETATTTAKLSSELTHTGADNRTDEITKMGGGDLSHGIEQLTKTGATVETSDSQATQKLIDKHGSQKVAEQKLTQSDAELSSLKGGDIESITQHKQRQFEEQVGRTEAQSEIVNPYNAGVIAGKESGNVLSGKEQAQYSPDYDKLTSEASHYRSAGEMGYAQKMNNIGSILGVHGSDIAYQEQASGAVSMTMPTGGNSDAIRSTLENYGIDTSTIGWNDLDDGKVSFTLNSGDGEKLANTSINQRFGSDFNHSNTTRTGTSTVDDNSQKSMSGTSHVSDNSNKSFAGTSHVSDNSNKSFAGTSSAVDNTSTVSTGNVWNLAQNQGIGAGFTVPTKAMNQLGIAASNGDDSARAAIASNIYSSITSLQSASGQYVDSSDIGGSLSLGKNSTLGTTTGTGGSISAGTSGSHSEINRNNLTYGRILTEVNDAFDSNPNNPFEGMKRSTELAKARYNEASEDLKDASTGSGNNAFFDTKEDDAYDKMEDKGTYDSKFN